MSVLVLAFNMSACQVKPDKVQPPSSILQKDVMIQVLADVHLAEAQGHLGRIPRSAQDSISYGAYLKALEKHRLSQDEFEESFKWYSQRPAVFEPMYDEVIAVIKEREQELFEKKKELHGTAEKKERKKIPADTVQMMKVEPAMPPKSGK